MITGTAGAFYQNGFGLSCACICTPGGLPRVGCWALGFVSVATRPPMFVLDASIIHALLLLEGCMGEGGPQADSMRVLAGK